jgi:phosphoserine phosphatase
MQHVLTITSAPGVPILTPDHTQAVRTSLAAIEATDIVETWLSPGNALDVSFRGPLGTSAKIAAQKALVDVPADINVQALVNRRKKLLIADMDSTIITDESLDELADFIGLRDQVAPITASAMRGEIDFDTALRDRVRLLAGQPTSILDRLLQERITLTNGAEALVRTMRNNGASTALVSGGFTFVTEAVATQVGFDTHRGNVLLSNDGVLTGEVGDPILGKDAKLASLQEFCAVHGLPPSEAMAVGDGANDIPMLLGAGTGVAYHAKPAVTEVAAFTIQHGDLTALLYLQGYSDREFIT